ncbi:MAG: hypothetical protein WCK31_05065, partial [bacterium]
MDNQNKNDKDKIRVITAEEVLEELRRRKKQYGSVYLPTNSYKVIKNGNPKVESNNTTTVKSASKQSDKNTNLRKAVLFLEAFAFKKPLQSVFTVLMVLGITTGVYVATRPVGELSNLDKAITMPATYLGIMKTSTNQFQFHSTPNIYCTVKDITAPLGSNEFSTCLARNIYATNVSKV